MITRYFKYLSVIFVAVLCSFLCSCVSENIEYKDDHESITSSETVESEEEYVINYELEKYTPYVKPYYDSTSNLINQGVIKSISAMPTVSFESPPPPSHSSFSIDFMGKSIEGIYSNSLNSSSTVRHGQYQYLYTTNDGDIFQINEKGTLVKWITGNNNSNNETKEEITLNEAINMCQAMLPEEFFSGFENYLVEVTMDPHTMPDVTKYGFVFISLKNGIQIDQRATFTVSLFGELLRFDSQNLGRYSDKSISEDFDDNKIIDIVKDILVDDSTEFDIESKYITLADDNTLICSVRIKIEGYQSLNIEIPLE